MESHHVITCVLFFALMMILAVPVLSSEFDVGDDNGWKVPSAKNPQVYNQWASKNRFQVGDTVKFAYEKDSVMEVTEKEYENCKSVHPIYFSNNGKTEIKLDHSGTFYFVSGIAGHCERGQKMIIKVISQDAPPAPPGPDSGGVAMLPSFATLQVLALLVAAVFF